MVDHIAMRNAMNRALEEIHNNHCNQCKDPFIEGSGEYTELLTMVKTYKIWYCDKCTKQEEEND
jgi:RNase P subunit RPR2